MKLHLSKRINYRFTGGIVSMQLPVHCNVCGQRTSTMFYILILSLLTVSVAFARTLYSRTIEDKDLSPVPSTAEKIIRSHPRGRDYVDCKFQGASLRSSDDSKKEFFVTTSNTCGWGAAQGPIFILGEENDAFTILLHTIGHSVEAYLIEGRQQRGLRVYGVHSITDYRFAVGHYVEIKTTFDR